MYRAFSVTLVAMSFLGCVHVKVDPVEVNATVNVNVKLDRAVNDFFGDLDKQSSTVAAPAK